MKFKVMKSLLLLGFAALLFSCSSDDNAGENQEDPQETLYYLDKIIHEGSEFEVELFSNHLVKKITLTNSSYEFEYIDELISRVILTDQNGVSSITNFEHDADGKISSFSKGEQTWEVDYNSATKTYNYLDIYEVFGADYSFEMNSEGDLKMFTKHYETTDQTESWGYAFDETKKGSLWNSNAVTVYVYMVNMNSLDVMLPFSKYPVSTVIHPAGHFACENQFNADGYIIQTEVNSEEVIFNYSEE